jgi:hypothetical protein
MFPIWDPRSLRQRERELRELAETERKRGEAQRTDWSSTRRPQR